MRPEGLDCFLFVSWSGHQGHGGRDGFFPSSPRNAPGEDLTYPDLAYKLIPETQVTGQGDSGVLWPGLSHMPVPMVWHMSGEHAGLLVPHHVQ